MKTTKLFLTYLLAVLFLASCSKDDPIEEIQEAKAPIVNPINGNEVIGEAKLIRRSESIGMQYTTSGLVPGHTYTIWWVVWNKPENCVGFPEPCDAPDFEIADQVEVEIMFADGGIADQYGKADFKGDLNKNDVSGSINDLFGLPSFNGLKTPGTAEVHLVLRSHGPVIPDKAYEQLHTYQGGCSIFLPDFTEVPDEEGECADLHFAVFQKS